MNAPDDYINLVRESGALFRKSDYEGAIAAIAHAERIDPLKAEFVQIQRAMQQRD